MKNEPTVFKQLSRLFSSLDFFSLLTEEEQMNIEAFDDSNEMEYLAGWDNCENIAPEGELPLFVITFSKVEVVTSEKDLVSVTLLSSRDSNRVVCFVKYQNRWYLEEDDQSHEDLISPVLYSHIHEYSPIEPVNMPAIKLDHTRENLERYFQLFQALKMHEEHLQIIQMREKMLKG